MLLPGDNEKPSWDELFKEADFKSAIKDVDILLAPHHGRESGYYNDLFKYFQPKLTIISDGKACDTSATERYREKCLGWNVAHRKKIMKRKKGTALRREMMEQYVLSLDIIKLSLLSLL